MIEQVFQSLLPSIEHFHSLAYWLALLVAFAETALVAGLLVPGSTLLLMLGALSATGHIDFVGVLWFGIVGAVLGDNLNYWLGKQYGQRWLKVGIWFLKPEHFEKAHQFFDRNGAKSVFFGRFIPSIKEIIPFIAGSASMHQGTFLLWNLLGAIGWGLQWIGGGYLFGQSLALAQAWMSRIGLFFLAIVLLLLLMWYVKHILIRQGPQIWLLMTSLYRSVTEALGANPYLKRFKRRHTSLIRFVIQRLDRSHFYGLPLTLLSLSLLYIAILFGGIIEDLLTSDPIVAVDHAVAQLVARFRPDFLLPLFTWITALGMSKVAAPLILLSTVGIWLSRGRWLAFALLVSAGGTALFAGLGKIAFQRPRPLEAVLLEHSYSFPSGHAAISVGLYGFFGYVLIRSSQNWKSQVNLLLLTLMIVFLIGLSRIVLGVHYLSDVWAGYLVGAGWLTIGIALTEWATVNDQIKWHTAVALHMKYGNWILVSVGLLWYLVLSTYWQPQLFTPPAVQNRHLEQPITEYIQQQKLIHTETVIGSQSQPLSVVFMAKNKQNLLTSLSNAGWQTADEPNATSLLKLLKDGMAYTRTPLAPVFWNGHINDLGLVRRAKVNNENMIDTLRLWQTNWLVGDAPVFVGVVRSYSKMSWGVLHQITPDTDAPTKRLLQSLKDLDINISACETHLLQSSIGNYLTGQPFFSSGDIRLIDLSGQEKTMICSSAK